MAASQQPPGADWETSGFGSRVNEIVDAVEREASKLREEAEQDAAQIRYQAQEEARQYTEQARQQSDALVAQRSQEIRELSDALMARAHEVLERLDYAVPVKAGFENLVRALGETAERLASQDQSQFAPPAWDQVRAAPPPAPEAPPPAAAPTDPGVPPAAPQPAPIPAQPAPAEPAPVSPVTQTSPPVGGQTSPGGWQQLDDIHRIAIQMAAAGSTRGEVEAHLAQAPAPTRDSVLDEIYGQGTPAETRVPWATPPQR